MMKGVLVTGGSGGIGSSLVRNLRADGREVTFTFQRQEDKARKLESQTGSKALHYDSSTPGSLEVLCSAVRESELDGLVNLAAHRVERQAFLKLDCERILERVQEGLLGPLRLSQAFAASCRDQKRSGAIVNVLTSYVLGLPPEKMLGYVMLKHALLGATRALAIELARYSIRVNAVSPAMTRTDYLSDLPERLIEMAEDGLPLKRLATPDEVSAVIAFLLSPSASYIQGANVPISGGTAC